MLNLGLIGADQRYFSFFQEIQETDIFHISLIFSEKIDPQLKDFADKNGIYVTDRLEDIFLPTHKIKLLVDTTDGSSVVHYILDIKPKEISVIDVNTLKLLMESINQRLQLEKRLLLLQKYETIGTLVSGICHEINNILMIIMGYAQLARLKVSSSNISSYISGIIDSCRRASNLIQQLLSFKSDGKNIEKRKVNLIPLVKETIKFAKEALPENIRISLDNFSKDLYEVEADLVSLRHALLNVITNSQEAMPEGGEIHVNLYNVKLDEQFCKKYQFIKPGEYVCISVKDTGVGIPEEILNRIFEPFFTTKDLGRGLGLSYTYGIVKQHNGYILVESELNKGTEVKIYLPAIKRHIDSITEELEAKCYCNKTILIVEDEEELIQIVSEFLENMGYRVLKAYNAKDALKIIEKEGKRIDIIMTDLILPDSFGSQLVYLAKKKKDNIKSILITGYKQKDEMISNELFDMIIYKPVSINTLANKIYKLLNNNNNNNYETA
ncbi:MAG: hypothetical protein DRG27_00590 [Deltaproteobacteria bacterium]|nr:MAG: hypothetical protein DRG27_00590 [Deltaproteobacteria bacterium]